MDLNWPQTELPCKAQRDAIALQRKNKTVNKRYSAELMKIFIKIDQSLSETLLVGRGGEEDSQIGRVGRVALREACRINTFHKNMLQSLLIH